MDLYDLYKTIVTGVARNSKLNIWATSKFGSALSVFAGMPSDSFPDMDEDTPFIIFAEPMRSCSQNNSTITYGCGAWMGLSISGDNTFNPSGANELAGVELILDGMRLVRLAVVDALPGGVYLDDFDEHADVNAVGSEVHGDMGFIFKEKLTIGQNPME